MADSAFAKLDIRVGKVLSVECHPKAEKLYVEQIDVGEEFPRKIVSGLRKHLSISDFVGKHVLVLCNLKPAKLCGVMSNGMVLCASHGETVELLEPVSVNDVNVGERVIVEGMTGDEPPASGNAMKKKKFWENCAKDMGSRPEGAPLAIYNGKLLHTQNSPDSWFISRTLKDYTIC